MSLIQYTENTGGDGVSGLTGLEVRTIYNRQFEALMGDQIFTPTTCVWTDASLGVASEDVAAMANKTVVITEDFNIGAGNITLPQNVILIFNGGSLLTTGTITGNKTQIKILQNKQIFSLSCTFAGTWHKSYAFPESFGAGASASISEITSGVGDAITKLFRSPFAPLFDLGSTYYIDKTIIVDNSVSCNWGENPVAQTEFYLNESGAWTANGMNYGKYVRFYTNLDINWFEIRVPNVNFNGGIFDITQINPFTAACIYTDANHAVYNLRMDQIVVGTKSITQLAGQTGKYFYWKSTDAIRINGCLYNTRINLQSVYCPFGVVIEDPRNADPTSGPGIYDYTWANGIHIKGYITGSKKAIIHNAPAFAVIDVICQSKNVLHATETDFYQIETSGSFGSIIDSFVWDMTPYPEDGFYHPRNGILVTGHGAMLQGKATFADIIGQVKGVPTLAVRKVDNASAIRLMQDDWSNGSFVSELHNLLKDFEAKGNTVTVKGYLGSGFDPLTQLQPATAVESTDIVLVDANKLTASYGYPTRYTFEGDSDLTNDFVEIVMDSDIDIRTREVYVYLMGTLSIVKKVQLIAYNSSDVVVFSQMQDSYAPQFTTKIRYDFLNLPNVYKLCIRLFGTGYDRQTATISVANPTVITAAKHGLSSLKPVQFSSTVGLPSGITAGLTYYVRNATTDTFNISTTTSGALVEVTAAGSGVHSFIPIDTNYILDIGAKGTSRINNYVPIASAPKASYHAILNQSGVEIPTAETLINTFTTTAGDIITPVYTILGVGQYKLAMSYAFSSRTVPASKLIKYTDMGRIEVTRNNDSEYLIDTYNTSGTLSHGILINYELFINKYW